MAASNQPRRRFAAALDLFRRRQSVFFVIALCAVSAACDGKRLGLSRQEAQHGTATVGGGVVSTVDGRPITVAEVQELVQAGLPAREALARLQAEQLLMADAERRGFGKLASVAQVAEQAQVQALLEAEAAAATVSDEELRAAYAKKIARFVKPERRASVHVLAGLPAHPTPEAEAAAKDFAERMLGGLSLATDLDAFLAAQKRKPKQAEFVISAEKIPAADRQGKVFALVEPYLEALYSVSEPGVVAAPVRTQFGWHAVRVTEILPAENVPYELAMPELREEILLVRRKERVQNLIEELRKTYRVEISADVGQTLAKLAL